MRFTLIFLAFMSVAALADDRESSLRRQIERLPPGDQQTLANAKYAGEFPQSELVSYSVQRARLIATFHLPPELVRQFDDPKPLIIALAGSPHVWSLHRRKSGTLDAGLSMITLTCYAPDETIPFNRYALSSDGYSLMISGAQMFGNVRFLNSLTLNQGEKVIYITSRVEADQFKPRKLELDAFDQVYTQGEQLVNYLAPILRRLGPSRTASDIYRVFDQIPADPKMTKLVEPLVARLDASDVAERDAALREITRLGRGAILATLRLDQNALSPEQRGRLFAFWASDGWLRVPDVEAARKDEGYLTTCLEDEDERVRLAARTMLAALKVGQ
jgi:hypothetical protein